MKTLLVLTLIGTLVTSGFSQVAKRGQDSASNKTMVTQPSRLGGTRTQLIARYGAGEEITPIKPAKKGLLWKLDGLVVEAHFYLDCAELMFVSKADGSMNGTEIQKILDSCGTGWKSVFQTKGGRWERAGAVAQTEGQKLRLETRTFTEARKAVEATEGSAAATNATRKF